MPEIGCSGKGFVEVGLVTKIHPKILQPDYVFVDIAISRFVGVTGLLVQVMIMNRYYAFAYTSLITLLAFLFLNSQSAHARGLELIDRIEADQPMDVVISGNKALVAAGGYITVVDISDPNNISVICRNITPGIAGEIILDGETAYVSDAYGGISIFDVTDLCDARLVANESLGDYVADIALSGSLLYVAGYGAGLYIFDVSTPSTPILKGLIDPAGTVDTVAVEGNFAYVGGSDGGGGNIFRSIDISIPANPVVVGTLSMTTLITNIAVRGQYAYVANYDKGLRILNISNPAVPTEVGFYDTNKWSMNVTLENNRAYVADQSGGMKIVDVATPSTPTLIGSYDTPGATYGIALFGTHAALADATAGLRIVNFSNLASIVETSYYDTPLKNIIAMVEVNDIVYLSGWASGFHTIDIANPSHPVIRDSFTSGYGLSARGATGLTVVGNYAYVSERDRFLRTFDVSNPDDITQVNDKTISNYSEHSVYHNGYLYQAMWGAGLAVFDIQSNPTNPTLVKQVNTITNASKIAANGNYLYISDYNNGFKVFDISSPTDPQLVTTSPQPGVVWSLDYHNNTLYIAADSSGLQIVDVSNPLVPVTLTSRTWARNGYTYRTMAVKVIGNYAYVGNSELGLSVLDISNPSAPREVGAADTPGAPSCFLSKGLYFYVGDNKGGFLTYRMTGRVSVTVSHNSEPLAGVSFQTVGINGPETDQSGNSLFSEIPIADNYFIKPRKDGYTFSPLQVQGQLSDDTSHSFTAELINLSISGTVFRDGKPVAGVEIDGGPLGTALTLADGSYLFPEVPYGTIYSIKPRKDGYSFSPVQVQGQLFDDASHSFTAELINLSISGTVFRDGIPVAGVEVDGGPLGTALTPADGSYLFPEVPYGTVYSIEVEDEDGYTFEQTSFQGTLLDDATYNFVAYANVISACVLDPTANNKPATDVMVRLGTRTTYTDSHGCFTLKGVPGGIQTIEILGIGTVVIQTTLGGSPEETETVVATPSSITDAFIPWNSFLKVYSIYEVTNTGSIPLDVAFSLYGPGGKKQPLGDEKAIIRPGEQRHLILQDLKNFSENTYGVLNVTLSHYNFYGQMINYRLDSEYDDTWISSEEQGFDYVSLVPMSGAQQGKCYVPFNTMQPSLNPEEQEYLVANWLTIINTSQVDNLGVSVRKYDERGRLIARSQENTGTVKERCEVINQALHCNIPPYGRIDIDGGHVDPGPGHVGLIEVIPDDDQSRYFASLTRYGTKSSPEYLAEHYSFANYYLCAARAEAETVGPVWRTESSTGYVELSNSSPDSTSIDLSVLNYQTGLSEHNHIKFNPMETKHVSIGDYLPSSGNGLARIIGSTSVLGSFEAYFHDRDGHLASASAVQFQAPQTYGGIAHV